MKNIFNQDVAAEVINRIILLSKNSQPLWGKMSVAQMLSHCNVSYQLVYEEKHPKPNAFKRFLLKLFVKNMVVSEKPYKKNGQTAPEFIIKENKDFDVEKSCLIDNITKTQQLGEKHFDGKESHSFGILTKNEWNNMFYKHLDHHLNQFAV